MVILASSAAYGNNKIERSTKKETITIEEPCIGILGLNTKESFFKALSAESLLDGFAQRFAFVLAERDPARSAKDFPIYDRKKIEKQVGAAFARITTVPLHAVYEIGNEATAAYKTAFGMLFQEHIPASFHRRIMFRSFRYALLYHILLEKPGAVLDPADIGWGARLAALHLDDVKTMLGRTPLGDIEKLAKKAQAIKEKLSKEGKKVTPRHLQQGIRGVKSAEEATVLLSLVE